MVNSITRNSKWSLALLLIVGVSLTACQQRLTPANGVTLDGSVQQSPLTPLGHILLDNNAIEVDNIITVNSSMYLAGQPFGLMRMEVSQSPTQPVLSFAVSSQQATFPETVNGVRQSWIYGQWAGGGMTVLGNLLLTSGTMGMSLVDVTQPTYPQEVSRTSSNGQVNQAFVYTAMAANPTQPIFYGTLRQQYLYVTSVGSQISLDQQVPYPGGVCCATDVAVFQGHLFVAMGNQMLVYTLDSSGHVASMTPSVVSLLQATAIRATTDKLYIVHNPAPGATSSNLARGIYVFNSSLQQVGMLDSTPTKFTLTNDDGYLYSVENSYVQIYSIAW